jgi:hypothetical protein
MAFIGLYNTAFPSRQSQKTPYRRRKVAYEEFLFGLHDPSCRGTAHNERFRRIEGAEQQGNLLARRNYEFDL